MTREPVLQRRRDGQRPPGDQQCQPGSHGRPPGCEMGFGSC